LLGFAGPSRSAMKVVSAVLDISEQQLTL
jgi:hypothetical protein